MVTGPRRPPGTEDGRRYWISWLLALPAWLVLIIVLFVKPADPNLASQIVIAATNLLTGVLGFWLGGALKGKTPEEKQGG